MQSESRIRASTLVVADELPFRQDVAFHRLHDLGLRSAGSQAENRVLWGIRLAPHFYSSVEDVDRAVDALAEILAGVS